MKLRLNKKGVTSIMMIIMISLILVAIISVSVMATMHMFLEMKRMHIEETLAKEGYTLKQENVIGKAPMEQYYEIKGYKAYIMIDEQFPE